MATLAQVEALLRDPSPVLFALGEAAVSFSVRAFTDQAFAGDPWPERYPNQDPGEMVNVAGVVSDLAAGRASIPARRFEDRPALVDTGALRDSITWRLAGADAVEVGSNLPYADMHQRGGISRQPVSSGMRRVLARFLKREKRRRPWLGKRLGFLFQKDMLETRVNARPFVGVTDELLETLAEIVEDQAERL